MSKGQENNYPQPDRWAYLWLIIGSILMAFIYGNWPMALAGWLAPLFLVRFIRTQKTLRGFIMLLIGLAIASTFAFQKGAGIAMIPLPIFGALVGFQMSLLFLIDRVLVARLPKEGFVSFVATLVFPLLCTAHEFLVFNKFLFGSSGSWAYSQQNNLVLMQIISITGLWGLTFITTWFASTINWIWERGFSWPTINRGVYIYGAILFLVLAFGSVRLRFFTPQTGTVRVHALVPLEEEPEQFVPQLFELWETDLDAFRQKTVSMYDPLIEGVIREARAGAQIVVLPENAAIGVKEDIDALIARSGQVAQAENIYLAMGLFEAENSEVRLVIIDPSGEVVLNHIKYAYGMGTPISEVDLQTVDTPYGRLSGVLCGDLDNPGVVRQAGQKGVDILLVPGMEDFKDMAVWHSQLAPFRAVENGFSLIRPTAGGVSIATDPYGRILAYMDYFKTNERVIAAQIPTQRVPTVYTAVGNVFGWLAVAGFVLIAVWAVIQGRKAKRRPKSVSSENRVLV